jgi:hypothetical protein
VTGPFWLRIKNGPTLTLSSPLLGRLVMIRRVCFDELMLECEDAELIDEKHF